MPANKRAVSRSNIDERNLLTYIKDGWLPIPKSIIPPERDFFLWDCLEVQPYDSTQDYDGKLIENLRTATLKTLCEWDDIESIDRVGVWLSGGIDSSILLYLTCEILGSEKVRAYSLDFGDSNEIERAKLIANKCDVKLVIKEMTADDSIAFTEETVLYQRGPVDTTEVPFISKLCRCDGTKKILSGNGLEQIQGGLKEHVTASDEKFFETETYILWRVQSDSSWVQRIQSIQYVDVKFPFQERELIAWGRGLPRSHKCIGQETKVRLRQELKAAHLIPEPNIEAGRLVGTKRPFSPLLKKWFEEGLEDWCRENLPPQGLTLKTRLKIEKMIITGSLWRRWRAATINTFFRLLDEGKFNYERSS